MGKNPFSEYAMLKKIIGIILTMTLGITVLAGCNLFEENTRKNYMQIVASIDSVEETQKIDGNDVTFKSEPKNIYKYELVSYLNQNGSNLIQKGMTLEQVVEYCVESLVTQELVFIEADRKIAFGEIDWRDGKKDYASDNGETVKDYTDVNRIKELVYDAIDSTLVNVRNEILTERGDELPKIENSAVDSETTYPVKPEEDSDKDETVREEEAFEPDKARFPGYYGDSDTKALGRETMRRFIQLLRNNTDPENNFSVTADDQAKFRQDDEKINKVINEQGVEYVYGMIYETHYINVLLKRNAERQVKLERLQNHITEGVTVTAKDVQDSYNALIKSQELLYGDLSQFKTAIKDGKEEILYFPTSKYFYVKHILLPFSKEQTARLTAKKNSGKYTDAEIKAFRDGLVAETVVYPHLNGENDMSKPMTVEQVWTQIKSAMKTVENSAKEAERLFDDYIYLYNTDSGIFNNAKGYVVEKELESGEAETYMQEFADGARELKNNSKYKVGMLLDYYVVTDYGVHIMYYANDTVAGERKDLSDWQTPGEYKQYYEILEETIKSDKESKEFEKWQSERITYYQKIKPIYTTYEKRYQDLIEQ